MNFKLALLGTLAFSPFCFAQDTDALTDEPTFRQIFRQSVEEAASLESFSKRESLAAELSAIVANPKDIVLSNRYFEVPHANALPGIQLGLFAEVAHVSRFRFSGVAGLGYAFHQTVGQGRSMTTGLSSRDSIKLQRIPFSFGLRAVVDAGIAEFFVEPALGVQWWDQSGFLDGVSQSFWIPSFSASGGVILFGRTSGWFGGLKLAGGWEKNIGSGQRAELTQFQIGIRARL